MSKAPDMAPLAVARMSVANDKLASRSEGFRVAAEAYEIAVLHDVPDVVLLDLWGLVQREGAIAETKG